MALKIGPSSFYYRLLPFAVFLAGFSFLQLEVSWFRMLTHITGATESASTLVLAAFLGGFGTGAWYWVRWSKTTRLENVLPGLFAAIALLALVTIPLFRYWLPALYSPLSAINQTLSTIAVPAVAWFALFATAFFMGGVFPSIVGLAMGSGRPLQQGLGSLYGWETAGSALGGLVTGFWTIGWLGQSITVVLAATLAFALGLLFQTARVPQPTDDILPLSSEKQKQKGRKGAAVESDQTPVFKNLAVWVAVVAGFGVIALQVLWFRIFKTYMTNSAYTFSLIASMVIVGLAAGSGWFATRKALPEKPEKMVGSLLGVMTLLVLGGFVLLINLPQVVMFPFESLGDNHAVRLLLIPFLSAMVVAFPVTFVSGYLFPLLCTLHAGKRDKAARSTGVLMLANSAGSVLGPVVATFLLVNALGAAKSVVAVAALFAMAAGVVVGAGHRWMRLAGLGTGSFLLLAVMVAPPVKILPPSFGRFPKEILDYNESVGGSYVVGAENKSGNNRVLSTYVNNSAVIGSTYDAIKVVKMVGHLPFFAGLPCKDVLVVGFGIGVTSSAIASHPEVRTIECVELVSGLKNAAHFYSHLNHGIERDPRLTVHQGDGRHFLLTTNRKFDLVTTDPTHPILGSASLYTREYFELCKSRLNSGGMMSQYMPLHKLLPSDFAGILATFKEVFPNSTVWLGHYHAVLLGFTTDVKIDFRHWSRRMSEMQPDPWFYNDPYALASCLAMDGSSINEFASGKKILTDNNPYTEYCSLKAFDSENLPANLRFMNTKRDAVNRLFFNIPDPALMQHYIEGNRLMTEALGHMLQGDQKNFTRVMQEAMVMNPDNQELPFMLQLAR